MSDNSDYAGEQMQEAAAPPVEQTNESYQEQSVPLSALQSERAQRQQLAEELQTMKDNLALLERNQYQASQPREEDIADDDIPTWGELKKYQSQKEREYQQTIQELKLAQKHPDYSEVVTKYLPNVLKQNPELRQTLEATHDYNLAYYLAKNSEAYQTRS